MSALRDTDGKLNWVLLFEHFPLGHERALSSP